MSRLKRPKLGARLSFPSHSLGPDPLALSPRTGCPPTQSGGGGPSQSYSDFLPHRGLQRPGKLSSQGG